MFDCAFKARKGERSIHYLGHIKMMGATQPFISGAISKTVNVPKEATVEEIMEAYIESWRLGAKAISIYRDGSKRTQPLNTSKDKTLAEVEKVVASMRQPVRRRLPDERQSITHKFDIAGHEGYITAGLFEDGTPGELFLVMAKEGSTISGFADAFAQAISYALQFGVPLQVLVDKFSHARFEPSGMTKNPDIRFAKSIVDYIFRWMATKFLSNDAQFHAGVNNREERRELDRPAARSRRRPRRRAPKRRNLPRRSRQRRPRMRPRPCRTRKTRRRAACAGRSWCGAAAATSARTAGARAAARKGTHRRGHERCYAESQRRGAERRKGGQVGTGPTQSVGPLVFPADVT